MDQSSPENNATLLSLADVARHLPPGPNGRKPSTTACWRWIVRGCGGVKLPALRLGHSWYVRPSDLEEFGLELARRSLEKLEHPAPPRMTADPRTEARSATRRARDIEAAHQVLRDAGAL